MTIFFELHHDRQSDLSPNGATWIVAPHISDVAGGLPTLTHDCASMRELNSAIDAMQANLDELRTLGKAQFAAIDKARAAGLDDHP